MKFEIPAKPGKKGVEMDSHEKAQNTQNKATGDTGSEKKFETFLKKKVKDFGNLECQGKPEWIKLHWSELIELFVSDDPETQTNCPLADQCLKRALKNGIS